MLLSDGVFGVGVIADKETKVLKSTTTAGVAIQSS